MHYEPNNSKVNNLNCKYLPQATEKETIIPHNLFSAVTKLNSLKPYKNLITSA